MKAFIFEQPGKGEVREVPAVTPGPGEVVVRIEVCGVCGTDMHIWQGSEPSARNIALGHEFTGVITEVGTNVRSYSPGDRVTVDPNIYCHACEYCLAGEVNLCANLKALGVDINGGFAQQCLTPVTQLHRLPDSMTWEEAALAEPLACALHGIERAELKPGQPTLIIGAGPMGLLMLQLARLRGAGRLMISEPVEWRRNLALELGADQAFDPANGPLIDQIPESARPKVVIECAGNPKTQGASIQVVKKGGTVVLFGDGHVEQSFTVGSYDFYFKNLTVRGAALNPYTHTRAVSLLAEHRLNVAALVTRRIALEALPGLLSQGYAAKDVKVLVAPNV